MLLPYASYLRVYERAMASASGRPGTAAVEPSTQPVATVTLVREQEAVLRRTVTGQPPEATDDPVGCYVLRRNGAVYVCPADLALRSWLAIADFVESTDAPIRRLFGGDESLKRTEAQYSTWRANSSGAVAHIRMATWGVPRTWFLLVAAAEREEYEQAGLPSARFRCPLPLARRRLAAARAVLTDMIDDEELSEELDDLDGWLSSFTEDTWLEVDYAGVAQLLGAALRQDRSAAEIGAAVEALKRRDFAAAGESYGAFMERWRVANALERAN